MIPYSVMARLSVLFGLLFCLWPSLAQTDTPRFTEGDCPMPLVANGPVVCGTLTVPEDRSGDLNDTIDLAVVIYKATGSSPRPDPIVFLQGGPGGRSIATVALTYSLQFAPLNTDYDIIVMDQRGTGYSRPALACPQVNQATLDTLSQVMTLAEMNTTLYESLMSCHDDLIAQGVNPAAYTSQENAADFADLLAALRIDQANFYGASYGTRLGQTILRETPQIVRSMVFDGVMPTETNQIGEQGRKTRAALQAMFDACQADSACRTAYPNLAEDFETALRQLRQDPRVLKIANPTTGQDEDVALTDASFISAVFLAQQQASTIPLVPQAIHEAAKGLYTNLNIFLVLPLLYLDAVDTGMFYSVMCNEEVLNTTPDDLDGQLSPYADLGDYVYSVTMGPAKNMFALCQDWGAKAVPSLDSQPIRSDLPALIISGQFDPATPPYLGQQLADNLPRSTHIILPGAGHASGLSSDCSRQIILAYFADPAAALDTQCLQDIPSVQFVGADYGTAAEDTPVELVEYRSKQDNLAGLAPQGWAEIQPGVFIRGKQLTDPTVVMQVKFSTPAADFWKTVGANFAIAEKPEPVGTQQANGYTYTLYRTPGRISGLDVILDVALAEQPDQTTLALVLITDEQERDALYNTVFVPMLNQLRLD